MIEEAIAEIGGTMLTKWQKQIGGRVFRKSWFPMPYLLESHEMFKAKVVSSSKCFTCAPKTKEGEIQSCLQDQFMQKQRKQMGEALVMSQVNIYHPH